MGEYLSFEYMYMNTVCSAVRINRRTKEVECTDYTDNVMMKFFGKNLPTIDNVNKMLRLRCISEHRPDIKEQLASIGLSTFSPLDICLHTKGRMASDKFWVRFDFDKDLTWEDVS